MNKTPKATSALIDFFLELRDLLKKPRFRSILVWMAILLASGTIFFSWVEGWSLLDSLYFSIVTLTTVGYGDLFPVTNSGRLISMMVMTAGVALFGVITGFLANAFLTPDEPRGNERADGEIDTGEVAEVAEIRRILENQDDVNERILLRLEKIEQLLMDEA